MIILPFIPLLLLHVVYFRCCCFRSLMPRANLRSMWLVWNVLLSYGITVISLYYLKKGSAFRTIFNPPFSLGLNLETMLVAQVFDHLMSLGKVSAALKLLSENTKGGVLSLDSQIPCGLDNNGGTLLKSVRDILAQKHPQVC